MVPGGRGGPHKRVKHCHLFQGENLFKKLLNHKSANLIKRRSNAESSCPRAVGATIKKSNFACVFMRSISQNDSGERCGPWASCFFVFFFVFVFVFFFVCFVFKCKHRVPARVIKNPLMKIHLGKKAQIYMIAS